MEGNFEVACFKCSIESDGKLSKEELPERFRDRVLDLMDSNNDEVLDRDEIESGKKTIQSMLRDRE